MTIYSNEALDENQVAANLATVSYDRFTNTSNFPTSIDSLKTISFSGVSNSELAASLNRYYELLIIKLQGSSFTAYETEFQTLALSLAKYQLTASDYAIMRDALLEVISYFESLVNTQLYNSPDGVLYRMQAAYAQFKIELDAIVAQINDGYSQLSQGAVGAIIPDGTLNLTYFDSTMQALFNAIDESTSIYVDDSLNSAVTVPSGLSKRPIVIKITE